MNRKTIPELGQKIQELRLQKGWTQEQLANEIGIERRQMQRFEKGDLPDHEKLLRLCDLFQTDLSRLIYTSNYDAPTAEPSLSDLQQMMRVVNRNTLINQELIGLVCLGKRIKDFRLEVSKIRDGISKKAVEQDNHREADK